MREDERRSRGEQRGAEERRVEKNSEHAII